MREIISFGSGPLNKEDGLDGDDEDVSEGWTSQKKDNYDFWSAVAAAVDKDDPRIIPPANNLETVPDVIPDEPFHGIITSWRKGEQLGKGSAGAVYKGITDDGFSFAVKEAPLSDPEKKLQLEQEISLLSQFEHKNIVRYLGTDKDNEKLYLFLELMPWSLSSLYNEQSLKESQVSAFTSQILEALEYLHNKMVIHRDIKCANILVDESRSVKLADFGLAKDTEKSAAKSLVGTPFYMAPEVVHNEDNSSYGLKADIWSLGCTVLEMLTGNPYFGLTEVQAWVKIYKCETPEVPEDLSRDARNFILRCLQVNPSDRPSAAQLLDDPFVREPPTSTGFASPRFNNIRS